MCMKYVNATVELFNAVEMGPNGNAVSFLGAFDYLRAQRSPNGDPVSGSFEVVTHLNLLGTDNRDNIPTCHVEQRSGILEVSIKLARVSTSTDKRKVLLLDQFDLDLEEMERSQQIRRACFNYLNYCRITHVNQMVFEPGPGDYVIKVEVRWKGDGENSPLAVQALCPLTVE